MEFSVEDFGEKEEPPKRSTTFGFAETPRRKEVASTRASAAARCSGNLVVRVQVRNCHLGLGGLGSGVGVWGSGVSALGN